MKFEAGKFYTHEGGRKVAVLCEVTSYKWGRMFVIEEADKTGHGISCMEINENSDMEALGWIEIGKEEWLRNFDKVTCPLCDKIINTDVTPDVISTPQGLAHPQCFAAAAKDRMRTLYAVDGNNEIILVQNQN